MMWLCMLACAEDTQTQEIYQSPVAPQEPALDVATIEARIHAGFEKGLPSPIVLRNLYGSFLSERESWCPHMENPDSTNWHGVWFDDCSTLDGYSFWGTAVFFEFTEPAWTMEAMASYELIDPQGFTFIGGGEYELDVVPNESWFFRVGGTFTYEPYGGWFAERGEASLFWDATYTDGVMQGRLDGGVGFSDIEFYFDGVFVDDAICDGLPQGEIMVRDESGFWFSLELADCKPCGGLMWNGEDQGEICMGEQLQGAILDWRAEIEAGPVQ